MNRSFILSACAFVFAVISSVCFGAENSDNQALLTKKAIERLDKIGVDRFEQMFQTESYNLNFRGLYHGESILHYAAMTGNLERVQMLVKIGMNVNEKDIDNESVLYFAAGSGNLEMVKYLIEKGAFANNSVLHAAAESGNLEMVKWLVEKGLDIKAKNNRKRTVLHNAAQSGNLEMVKFLVEKGANVNAKTNYGYTAALAAGSEVNPKYQIGIRIPKDTLWEIVKYLVEKGADVNAKENDGTTILDYAARSGNKKMVDWLKAHGAKE